MSKSREATGNTPPLSSGAETGDAAQQSRPSASSDNTPTSTLITSQQLPPTSSVEVSDQARKHALIARVALLSLEKIGLCKRYTVLSENGMVTEIQIVFDPAIWTPDMELRA